MHRLESDLGPLQELASRAGGRATLALALTLPGWDTPLSTPALAHLKLQVFPGRSGWTSCPCFSLRPQD